MRATCGTTTVTIVPDDSTINFDERHDNDDGRYATATGGKTTRHAETERTTTSMGSMMMTRGIRATGGTTTATREPNDSTIN